MAKSNLRRIIASSSAAVSLLCMLSGCAKKVNCSISEPHAHNYVNEESLDKYVVSERVSLGNWKRTDEYIVSSNDIEDLIEFENKNELFRISHNEDKIKEKLQLFMII